MLSRMRVMLAGAALLCALSGGAARAEDITDETAKHLYQEGKVAFEQLKYQLAFDRFKAAYSVSHQAELLFDMAACQQSLGHPEAAADLLRAYLKVMPDDPERPGIERRIRALDEQRRDEERPKPPPTPQVVTPPPPSLHPVIVAPAPPPPRRWYQDPAGYALFFGGAAILGGGGALLGIGNSRMSGIAGQGTYGGYIDARDGAKPLQLSGIALLGAGGALALGGVIRFIVVGTRKR